MNHCPLGCVALVRERGPGAMMLHFTQGLPVPGNSLPMMRPLKSWKKRVLRMLVIGNDGIMQSTLIGEGRVLKEEKVIHLIMIPCIDNVRPEHF